MHSDVRKIYFAARRCGECSADALLARLKACEQNAKYVDGLCRGANSDARLGALELLLDLAERLGVDASTLVLARGAHGKPYFDTDGSKPYFSLSHTGNIALAALSLDGEIGADVELTDKYTDERRDKIANRFFSDAERAYYMNSDYPQTEFFKLWTQKEALSKCLGTGEPYLYDTAASRHCFESFSADGAIISLCSECEFSAHSIDVSNGIVIDTENKL